MKSTIIAALAATIVNPAKAVDWLKSTSDNMCYLVCSKASTRLQTALSLNDSCPNLALLLACFGSRFN